MGSCEHFLFKAADIRVDYFEVAICRRPFEEIADDYRKQNLGPCLVTERFLSGVAFNLSYCFHGTGNIELKKVQ